MKYTFTRDARRYRRAVLVSGAEAAATYAWVSAAALPPRKRLLLRTAVVAALAAAGAAIDKSSGSAADTDEDNEAASAATAVGSAPRCGSGGSPGVLAVAGVSVIVAGAVGGHWVQRRWLARLARAGHPYPHRALGTRMAILTLATSLPSRLVDVHASGSGRDGSRHELKYP
jgi:hypothetical protein